MRCALTFYDINRWVSVRVDSLGGLFAGAVATYLLYGPSLTAGSVGFTLSVVLQFSQGVLYWVRFYNLAEIEGRRVIIYEPE